MVVIFASEELSESFLVRKLFGFISLGQKENTVFSSYLFLGLLFMYCWQNKSM